MLTLTTVYAKSYGFDISLPIHVGKAQLKPGRYHLTVEGDIATFKSEDGGSFTAPCKVQNGDKKFKSTVVNSAGEKIESIELGGTTMKVQFTE